MIPTTFALFERVEIGSVTPVGAIPGQLGKITVLLQVRQRPLDGAAGEIHISRNRLDTGPAASCTIGPILEVHINGYSSGRQKRVGVNAVKVTHRSTSCRGRLYGVRLCGIRS